MIKLFTRARAAILVVAACTIAVLPSPTDAQTLPITGIFTASLSSGLPGTTILAASSTPCPRMTGPDGKPPTGSLAVPGVRVSVSVVGPDGVFSDQVEIPMGLDGGSWSATLKLRDDFPAGPATIEASCFVGRGTDVNYAVLPYAPLPFTVLNFPRTGPGPTAPTPVQVVPQFTG